MKTTKALFARGMHHLTETNLECYFLAGIIVEIKTKGVKTLFSKSIGAAGPGIWIKVRAIATVPGVPRKR